MTRLVHGRFGLHVIEVPGREPGVAQPFESAFGAMAVRRLARKPISPCNA